MLETAIRGPRTTSTVARPARVGLVQINNSFSNQNYFPYSVGMLQAYAQSHLSDPGAFDFGLPIYSRIRVDEAVEQLEDKAVVFFSTYVWNVRISLEIARRLKAKKPQVLTVFGGPQVPNRAQEFLSTNPFIDLVCHGEGESVFLSILTEGLAGAWAKIPSISYPMPDGAVVQNPAGSRLKDLSGVPSPYLSGVFDRLMEANPAENWIGLWETNRGCPFSCTFCDWGSATASKVYQFDMERLCREVDWFADHKIEFIFCADANFGILPRDLDLVTYVAQVKQARRYPRALSVQNTKNASDRAYRVQKVLADAGLNKGVTISFQSVDPTTLKSIKRDNISTTSFQKLQRQFTRDRVETYSDMILGLPGETYDSFVKGVSAIIENGQHNRIQFNNLSILPNAEMGDPEYQKQYGMQIVSTKVVNIHGSLVDAEEISETQELVVATNSMPPADWVRTRAFCWMTALLHFNKILQIPLVCLAQLGSVSYGDLIQLFSEGDLSRYPTLAGVRDTFHKKAVDIQQGGAEYCQAEQWLNIWWPADEFVFITLCVEDKLDRFYAEAQELLMNYVCECGLSIPESVLEDAIRLNRSLVKRPFLTGEIEVDSSSDVWAYYKDVLQGEEARLRVEPCHYHVDRSTDRWASWDDWCREVVWYGNKKGAYLYANRPVELQLAGHF